jgi:hypothetical protein
MNKKNQMTKLANAINNLSVTRKKTGKQPRRKTKRLPRRFVGTESLYLNSLRDPENFPGARCPVPCGVPTGTFQIVHREAASIVTSAGGRRATGIWVAPAINTGSHAGLLAIDDTGVLTWSTFSDIPGSSTARGIYSDIRVVSACVKFMWTGSTLNDSGQSIGDWSMGGTAGTTNVSNGVPASVNAINSSSYSEMYPTRNGMCVTWRPADYHHMEFLRSTNTASAQPCVGIVVDGLQEGASGMWVTTINYEGTPSSNTSSFIQTATTPTSGLSGVAERALQWAQTQSDKIYPLFSAIAGRVAQQGFAYATNRLIDRNQRSQRLLRSPLDELD